MLGILTSFYVDSSPVSLRSTRNFIEIPSPPTIPASPSTQPPPPSQPVPDQSTKLATNTTASPADNETTSVVDDEQVQLKDYLEPRAKAMHNMTEEQLFWRASMVPMISKPPFERKPKVAFLFLTRGEIPFAELWDMFFKGHDGLYSIYWHADPSFNESVPEHSVFHGRRIPSKVISMILINLKLFQGLFLKLHHDSIFLNVSGEVLPVFFLNSNLVIN